MLAAFRGFGAPRGAVWALPAPPPPAPPSPAVGIGSSCIPIWGLFPSGLPWAPLLGSAPSQLPLLGGGLSSSQPLGLRAHVFQGHVMSLQPLVLGSQPLSLELCSHLSPPSCHSHHGGPQQPRCARPEVPLSAWLSAAPHLSWRRGGRSLTTGRAPRRTWPPGAGGAGR